MFRLNKNQYFRALEALENVPINTIFAQTVALGWADGQIFVDEPENPEAFYIAHPYGMSLLIGETRSARFTEALRYYLLEGGHLRTNMQYLQVYPDHWDCLLGEMMASDNQQKPLIEKHSRVNFEFDQEAYQTFRAKHISNGVVVVPTTKRHFVEMPGTVIPRAFWRDPWQFARHGAGFSVLVDGNLAAVAFSAFRLGNQLEIGIETVEPFRGKGLALHACMALVDYCIGHKLVPVWACRLENWASYRLALKLGFKTQRVMPYYKLNRQVPENVSGADLHKHSELCFVGHKV